MRTKLIDQEIRVIFSESQFENLILDEAEKMGDERLELTIRLIARSSPRIGKAVEITPEDLFIPDIADVKIPFVHLEGTKDTSGKDTVVDGEMRVSWVPKDLYDDLMARVERENIADDEEIIDVGANRISQLIRTLRSRLSERTGRSEWEHLTSHDFRAFFCTNNIRNYNVGKPLVMMMGGWENEESLDPYLATPTLKEIQDELSRSGIIDQDVPTSPQREDLNYVADRIERLKKEMKRLRRDLGLEDVRDTADISLDEIEEIKKEALRRKEEETPTDASLDQFIAEEDRPVGNKEEVRGVMASLFALYWKAATRATDWMGDTWDTHVGFSPLEWMEKSHWRQKAFFALMVPICFGIMTIPLADTGVWIDPLAGEWSVTPQGIGTLAAVYLLVHFHLGTAQEEALEELTGIDGLADRLTLSLPGLSESPGLDDDAPEPGLDKFV